MICLTQNGLSLNGKSELIFFTLYLGVVSHTCTEAGLELKSLYCLVKRDSL